MLHERDVVDFPDIKPPTSFLPPIAKLHNFKAGELRQAVRYLRFLYNPEVRGSRRILHLESPVAKSSRQLAFANSSDASQYSSILETIQGDSFERSYVVRWLTALVSRADLLSPDGDEQISIDSVVQEAASLLAVCSGAAASGKVTRTFVFGPSESVGEIRVELTDAPLESQDFSSVGAQTWGSACVMAEMIVEAPQDFGMPLPTNSSPFSKARPYRILELGAGTGLVGLTSARVLESLRLHGDVLLTDFHPSVLANLRTNVENSFPAAGRTSSGVAVESCRLDWANLSPEDRSEPLFCTPFDLVLGADIIYEEKHAEWIKRCLETLLPRPDSEYEALFHLVIPLRRTHAFESSTIEKVFRHSRSRQPETPGDQAPALVIKEFQRLMCEAHNNVYGRMADRGEEVEYAYFKIGWDST